MGHNRESAERSKYISALPGTAWNTVHIRLDMNRASKRDLFLATSGRNI